MDCSTITLPLKEVQFQAQRNLMRQFMIMRDEGQVPSYITMRHMKDWLMAGDCWQECQNVTENVTSRTLHLAELTWYSKRRLGLGEMEEELCKVLNNEHHLSQQFGRKVTMEGLQMLIEKIRPALEEDVQRILLPVYAGFPHSIMVVQEVKSGPENPDVEGFKQKQKLAKSMFLQGAESLFPEIVKLALKHLLENRLEAASTPAVGNGPSPFMQPRIARLHSIEKRIEDAAVREVTKLVEKAAAEFLCHFGNVPMVILSAISKAVSGDVVCALYSKFEEASKSFNLIGFDGTSFGTRDTVQDLVWDMTRKFQGATSCPSPNEQTITKRITESLKIPIVSSSENNVEVSSAAIEDISEVDNTQKKGLVEDQTNPTIKDMLKEEEDQTIKPCLASEVEKKTPEQKIIKEEDDVTRAHSSKHEEFLKQLDQISKEDKLAAKENHVKVKAGKLAKVSVGTQTDQILKPRLVSAKKPVMSLVSASENNHVEGSSAAIKSVDISGVDETQKKGLVKIQADPTIKDVLKEEDQTIKPCLASEPTERKLEVGSRVPGKCSDNGHQLQKKKQKKGGIRGFFRGVWKVMTCSTGIPNEEE